MAKASFFLYFSDEGAATAAGDRLTEDGYAVDVSADGDRWLARADKKLREHDIDKAEQQMQAIEVEFGARYDGYDTD